MRSALDILDQIEAPGEVGAMLDLAIVRLEEWIGKCGITNVGAMIAQIERELTGSPTSPWNVPSD